MGTDEKTYFKSEKLGAILDILLLLAKKSEGFTAEEVATELAIKESSVRNYLSLIRNKNLAEKQGEKYIVGQGAAQLWSRRIAHLNTKKQQAEKALKELGE